MKKCLFLCNTSYQVLFAANFAYQNKNANTYVIVTDMIADYLSCAEKVAEVNLFCGVYPLCIKKIDMQPMKRNFVRNVLQRCGIRPQYLRQVFEGIAFDELYCANFNYHVTALYKELTIRNPQMTFYMFEDGFATYSRACGKTLQKILHPEDAIHRLTRKLVFEAFYHMQGLLCFRPELVEWKPAAPLVRIKGIDTKDKRFIQLVSDMFGYNDLSETYEQKFIFFEESYYGMGYDIGDMEIVEKIAQKVGKENLFIKIHPSNPHNRFAERGYHTNKNTSVPWEIIALNLPLEDKVLLTVSSVSVLTPHVLLGLQYKAVMLYKCVKEQSLMYQEMLRTYERICAQTGAVISVPASLDQADKTIWCGVLKG